MIRSTHLFLLLLCFLFVSSRSQAQLKANQLLLVGNDSIFSVRTGQIAGCVAGTFQVSKEALISALKIGTPVWIFNGKRQIQSKISQIKTRTDSSTYQPELIDFYTEKNSDFGGRQVLALQPFPNQVAWEISEPSPKQNDEIKSDFLSRIEKEWLLFKGDPKFKEYFARSEYGWGCKGWFKPGMKVDSLDKIKTHQLTGQQVISFPVIHRQLNLYLYIGCDYRNAGEWIDYQARYKDSKNSTWENAFTGGHTLDFFGDVDGDGLLDAFSQTPSSGFELISPFSKDSKRGRLATDCGVYQQ